VNQEDREILWSALMAGLIAGGVVSAIWLCVQIVNQLEIQLS
jgi:hypothetical protein